MDSYLICCFLVCLLDFCAIFDFLLLVLRSGLFLSISCELESSSSEMSSSSELSEELESLSEELELLSSYSYSDVSLVCLMMFMLSEWVSTGRLCFRWAFWRCLRKRWQSHLFIRSRFIGVGIFWPRTVGSGGLFYVFVCRGWLLVWGWRVFLFWRGVLFLVWLSSWIVCDGVV